MRPLQKPPVPCVPRPFPPKPKPLPKRRTVTIAAGILCEDGVLVCADSEMTLHTMKSNDPKVDWVLHDSVRVIMTGAGDAHLLRYVVQQCRKAIPEGATMDDAEQTIRAVIREVHTDHIYPVSRLVEHRPNIEMAFGLWEPGRKCKLFESRGTALIENNVSLLGSGYEFGRSVCDRLGGDLYNAMLPRALIVAMRMLKEVKEYVQGCGGQDHIITLGSNGRIYTVLSTHSDLNDRFDAMEEALRDVIAEMTSLPDGQSLERFKTSLRRFETLAEGLRESKAMKRIHDGLKDAWF